MTDEELIIGLFKEGLPIKLIAHKMEIGAVRVRQVLNCNGLAGPRVSNYGIIAKLAHEAGISKRDMLLRLLDEHGTVTNIAKAIGLTRPAVYSAMKGEKIDLPGIYKQVIVVGGKEATFLEHCRSNGLAPTTVYGRVKRLGWDMEKAMNTPVYATVPSRRNCEEMAG